MGEGLGVRALSLSEQKQRCRATEGRLTALQIQSVSPLDYLLWERVQDGKHEYCRGAITPMVGFNARHSLITVSTMVRLHSQLRGSESQVYTSQMRLKTPDGQLYTYPDVMIVRGQSVFEDEHTDTLLNPTMIIEVLSDVTQAYDRGDKFLRYKNIPSFREYLLSRQDIPHIDHYFRTDHDWLSSQAMMYPRNRTVK
jgi:Uma2 family endonuclease